MLLRRFLSPRAGLFQRVLQRISRRSFSSNIKELDRIKEAIDSIKSDTSKCEIPGHFVLGFTCKVCDTRTHRSISKQSYHKGLVLVECPGCKNRHLIADNLGWFDKDHRMDCKNIEEIVKLKGGKIVRNIEEIIEVFENPEVIK